MAKTASGVERTAHAPRLCLLDLSISSHHSVQHMVWLHRQTAGSLREGRTYSMHDVQPALSLKGPLSCLARLDMDSSAGLASTQPRSRRNSLILPRTIRQAVLAIARGSIRSHSTVSGSRSS